MFPGVLVFGSQRFVLLLLECVYEGNSTFCVYILIRQLNSWKWICFPITKRGGEQQANQQQVFSFLFRYPQALKPLLLSKTMQSMCFCVLHVQTHEKWELQRCLLRRKHPRCVPGHRLSQSSLTQSAVFNAAFSIPAATGICSS